MKAIKLLVFTAIVTFAGINANAQTVDEIVNKNIDAMGGKDKMNALKTVKMTGSMSAQGMDIPITITKSHMVGMRIDFDVNGTSNYQLVNPKQGWVFMPIRGDASPQEMEAEQFKSTSNQMDVQGALMNYKEKGSTVVLDGSEKVDGSDAYKLKLTYQNGKTMTYYIDKKTNRLVKTSGKATMQGQEMDVETTFSDYKQNKDGYWFAYSVTNPQGPITFSQIDTNVPVDAKLFSN